MQRMKKDDRHRKTWTQETEQSTANLRKLSERRRPQSREFAQRRNQVVSTCSQLPTWTNYDEGLWETLPFGITGDYEEVYNRLAPELDPDGFRLFWAAEQQTGINIYRAFPIEDSLGYFESMSGYAILEWLEAEAFGTYDLETRAPGIQVICKLKINKGTEQYKAYRRAIYEQAVKAMLRKRS